GFEGLAMQDADGHPPLVTAGSLGTREEAFFRQSCAIYVNPLPGSGRSVPHVHINVVSALSVTLPTAEPAPWMVGRDVNDGTSICRLIGLKYYALVVQGKPNDVAETAALLHVAFNRWGLPYNLLAYPLFTGGQVQEVRLVVVPRDCEYCPAADQRIAGLELLTGVVVPGPRVQLPMSVHQRDLAFWQASLKGERWLDLERRLRGLFGLPPAGLAVYAAYAAPA